MKKLLFLGLLGVSSIQIFSAAGGGGAGRPVFSLETATDEELADTRTYRENQIQTIREQIQDLQQQLADQQTQLAALKDEQERRVYVNLSADAPISTEDEITLFIKIADAVRDRTVYTVKIGNNNYVGHIIRAFKTQYPQFADENYRLLGEGDKIFNHQRIKDANIWENKLWIQSI